MLLRSEYLSVRKGLDSCLVGILEEEKVEEAEAARCCGGIIRGLDNLLVMWFDLSDLSLSVE